MRKHVNIEVSNEDMNLKKIQIYLQNFIIDRGWEKYRTPKNLCMALSVETSELLELFQWDNNSSPVQVMMNKELTNRVKEEVADIFSYLVQFCHILNINLEEAFWEKTKLNEEKYSIKH